MKYRLGLDLGVSSIGSAVILLDHDNNAVDIVDAGVRIFKISEGAEDRRLKRTARKNLNRTKKRLELLAQKLFENQLWVNATTDGTARLRAKSPYEIRKQALYEKLDNPFYIGRAILHLAKHRGAGFVSASQEMCDETEENIKKQKSSYDMMAEYLKISNSKTIGEFFYDRLKSSYEKDENGKKKFPEKRIIRQKAYALEKHIVDYAIPRYLVKDEFNQIWDKQAQYFSQMNKENLKKEVYDILFYEKPAAPYATGKCIYFKEEDRLLKAHPLFEMRRIYEEVNNIRIVEDMGHRRLNIEERNKIINELLLKGINVGKKNIKQILNLSGQIKISLPDDRIIKAYLYARPEFAEFTYIRNLSEEDLIQFAEFLANPQIPGDKDGRLYNEDGLICVLKNLLGSNDEKAIGKLLTKLPKGRGNLGITATKKLLEKLKEKVLSVREITDELTKTDTHFMAEEEFSRYMKGSYDKLPYYGEILQTDTQPLPPLVLKYQSSLNKDEMKWGRVANPAVHMILNQIRLVVNDIIRLYGKPYQIALEVGRDVGLSAKKKNDLDKKQKANEKLNEQAKNYLLAHNLYINKTNILKYKLATEQCFCDAYDPRKKIPQNFVGFEIEHICPQADEGSDTYNNLCLVDRNSNLGKGKKFAYEWFEEKYKNEPEVIREILANARKRMPQKAWRFEPDAREVYEDQGDIDETSRYLTDTRYVAKMAYRYLKAVVSNDNIHENSIISIRGKQTAELRRRWNLLGLEYDLVGLDIPRYFKLENERINPNTGEITDKEKNPEWMAKPRIDHRHHAMDAITVASANWWIVQQLSNEEKLERVWINKKPLLNVDNLRSRILEVLRQIKVSHKPEHSKLGQMHKETGRKVLCHNPEDDNALITVYVRDILQNIKSFNDLNKLIIPSTIKNEWHQDIALDRDNQLKLKENIEKYANTAEQILVEENRKAVEEGKKEIQITEARILAKAFYMVQENGLWKGNKFKCYENNSSLIYIPKHNLAYEGRNNYCIDFYQKDGKVGWEVIKCFDINQKDFIPQWKKDGGKIIWSAQQGDLLELDTPEEWQGYTDKNRCFAKIKKFSAGHISLDYFTDARGTTKAKTEPDYLLVNTLDNRGLSYLTKHSVRKVELTPFGKMKKKHKVLWSGKKTKN